MNAETLSELGVDGSVDLGNVEGGIVSGKGLSSLGILRGKTLTMTAKGEIRLDTLRNEV